jgi:hypothetical protein
MLISAKSIQIILMVRKQFQESMSRFVERRLQAAKTLLEVEHGHKCWNT